MINISCKIFQDTALFQWMGRQTYTQTPDERNEIQHTWWEEWNSIYTLISLGNKVVFEENVRTRSKLPSI